MGARGPAPLPASLHAQRGTFRPDRHGAGGELVLGGKPAEAPEAPDHLSELEAECWRELVPILHAGGVLDLVDAWALEACIVTVARARLADQLLRAEGATLMVRGDRGSVQNPLVKISRDAWAEARAWFAKFGATPSDRVGLAVGGLTGMTLQAQLAQALGVAPRPLDASAQLAIDVGGCGYETRDGRGCKRAAAHAGRHRYEARS